MGEVETNIIKKFCDICGREITTKEEYVPTYIDRWLNKYTKCVYVKPGGVFYSCRTCLKSFIKWAEDRGLEIDKKIKQQVEKTPRGGGS